MSGPIVVIGTGPAGVSVARPLLEAGLPLTLIDAGFDASPTVQTDRPSLAALRQSSPQAWRYLIGEDCRGLRWMPDLSPKLRLARDPENHTGFAALNRIAGSNFTPVGGLVIGGLSNIWGAVTYAYDDSDMAGWPIGADELAPHYRRVSSRIGVSGPPASDLDRALAPLVLQDPLPLTPFEGRILARYRRGSKRAGFRLDRLRLAVLSADRGERKACNLDMACMLGCERGAIYNAAYETAELVRHPGVSLLQGFAVERLVPGEAGWHIEGRDRHTGERRRSAAGKVILAAGALASTRLAMDAVGIDGASVRLENNPTIAFAVLFPAMLGSTIPAEAFGLAQIGFSRRLSMADPADEMIGALYPAAAMSAADLLLRLPVSIPGGRALLRDMLPGLMIGLAFLPGRYSDNRVRLAPAPDDLPRLEIAGGYTAAFAAVSKTAIQRLRWDLLRLGGILLPGSVQVLDQGADVHYAGSLAMGRHTDTLGQVAGVPGLHVVDGAVLPTMPARNPTLTIMANADRIGAALATARATR